MLTLARSAAPFCLSLALLTACGGATTDQAARLPAPETTRAAPPQPASPQMGEDAARALLFPLAQAAPLPSDAPFAWMWWSGSVPEGVQAQQWPEFNDWRADQMADHGGATRGPEWDAFERGLKTAFPDGLVVYQFPAQPGEGRRAASTVIIEGRAPWGTGGFLATVQDDN